MVVSFTPTLESLREEKAGLIEQMSELNALWKRVTDTQKELSEEMKNTRQMLMAVESQIEDFEKVSEEPTRINKAQSEQEEFTL